MKKKKKQNTEIGLRLARRVSRPVHCGSHGAQPATNAEQTQEGKDPDGGAHLTSRTEATWVYLSLCRPPLLRTCPHLRLPAGPLGEMG